MAPWAQSDTMNTRTCSLKSMNPLTSYPSPKKWDHLPSYRNSLSNSFQPLRFYRVSALSTSSKFRLPKGLHFWLGGKTKEVGVNFFDPGEILNGGSKRKTKLCLSVGPIDCVCMTGPHRWKGMRFLPLTGRSAYRGHSSFSKSFVAWGYSRMLVKLNLVLFFFGHSQNQLRLRRRAGTPSSLSKVIIYFHGAGPTSPRGCRGYNPQARVTLSRGVCVFLSRVQLFAAP